MFGARRRERARHAAELASFWREMRRTESEIEALRAYADALGQRLEECGDIAAQLLLTTRDWTTSLPVQELRGQLVEIVFRAGGPT